MIERLRIMHDLVKDQNYSAITKAEITSDLEETFEKLKDDFEAFLQ
jgi:hypothetical protein